MITVATTEFLNDFNMLDIAQTIENRISFDTIVRRGKSAMYNAIMIHDNKSIKEERFLDLYRNKDTEPLVYIESAEWADYTITEIEKTMDKYYIPYHTITEGVDKYSRKKILKNVVFEDEVIIVDITHMDKVKRKKLIKLRKSLNKLKALMIFVSDTKKDWVNLHHFDVIMKKNVILRQNKTHQDFSSLYPSIIDHIKK